jgi:hypothetical protein|tara:strand:+ start:48 stop:770 length:723 start_codon:yes stop_codon:yes gene_type:complete
LNLQNLYRLPLYLVIFFFVFCSCNEQVKTSEAEDVNPIEQAIPKGISNEQQVPIYVDVELSATNYIAWVKNEDNQLNRSKTIQDIRFRVNYLPLDYMLCNELKKSNVSKKELELLKQEYNGMEYYELKIEALKFNDELAKYQLQSQGQYQERIQYLAFDMQNNISLQTEDNRLVECKLYHFERTYGITPYSTFLLGFSKEDIAAAKERTIVIDDKLFNKGLIKFNWTEQALNNVPKLSVI